MACSIMSNSWIKTAPMATSGASTAKEKGWAKFVGLKIGCVANLDFKFKKARSASAIQMNLVPFLRRSESAAERWAKWVQTYYSTQPNLGTAGAAYGWWGLQSPIQLVPSWLAAAHGSDPRDVPSSRLQRLQNNSQGQVGSSDT